ncbi:hypothetical protein THAOC_20479, partial [Thalassiosira oceanica]
MIGDHVAGLDSLNSFNPQTLSNTAWAFASAEVPHPELLRKIGDHIAGQMSLISFEPQNLSNTAWAYAAAGDLDSFDPKVLSITAWAFATAGVSHDELFKKIGNHVTGPGGLGSFKPQDLSNTIWAFATAGVLHPELFNMIGHHVAELGSLDSFKAQALSNTAWALATAGVSHPELFNKIGNHIAGLGSLDSFKPQELSNTLWACASVCYTDERLFSALAPVIASKLDKCSEQDLANVAWAYSVANTPRQDLFDEGYVSALASNENEFSGKELAQLHQWQLWQQELESRIELQGPFQAKCRNAFTSRGYSESKLQNDVVDELKAAGLVLDEEVLLGSGYLIDALVEFNDGRKVAVEVDGPSHFIDRRPAGRTILKHRQVAKMDHIKVVSVPYWEWDELKNSEMKQRYLREKLSNGQFEVFQSQDLSAHVGPSQEPKNKRRLVFPAVLFLSPMHGHLLHLVEHGLDLEVVGLFP